MITPKLTIVILNHNTRDILSDCLKSLEKVKKELPFEVIVSDNSSTDGSPEMIREKFEWVILTEGPNTSFSNGNNRARDLIKGKYVLFLNSDTLVPKDTLLKTVAYMEKDKKIGALTCKLVLQNGKLDKDARRRFPTPWISFNRLFLRNGSRYWYEEIPENTTHEVEAIQGAFFLSPKEVLDKVGWWDERFIFDGEDLDLSFQIKKAGYKIIYYPEVYITHLKGFSKGVVNNSNVKVDPRLKIKRRMEGVNSMELFYKKNMWSKYPLLLNYFILCGIKFLKLLRYIQVKYL